ncbi:MAG: cell wall hydrolase/autolysin [Actinobacteria bacterium]|nr:cell wall hydrolase/autolysin [Actinomycetota bacterium]
MQGETSRIFALRPRLSARVRARRALLALSALVLAATLIGRAAVRGPTTAPAAAPSLTPKATPASSADSTFAAGACRTLAPTTRGRGQTVLLDAGHGGPDPGASGTTTTGKRVNESQLTLPVVLAAAASLRADGYRVTLSRTVDTSVARLGPGDVTRSGLLSLAGEHADTQARVTCANRSGAAALVSVHFNAFSDPTARGSLTAYDSARTFSASNRQLAQLVEGDVVAALNAAGWQVPDRGIIDDATLNAPALSAQANAYGHLLLLGPAAAGWLSTPSAMPGVLVEPFFLANATEATVAADPAGQQAIAAGITRAIEQFLAVPGGSAAP